MIGDRSGWSHVRQIPGGILRLDAATSIEGKTVEVELARRVAQWPVPAKRTKLGAGSAQAVRVVSLRPMMPATTSTRQKMRAALAGSRNTAMPTSAVPTAPMPTQTA